MTDLVTELTDDDIRTELDPLAPRSSVDDDGTDDSDAADEGDADGGDADTDGTDGGDADGTDA